MKVENRTFIVSGGSSGLGLATVERLAALKAYVSILDRDAPPPELLSTPYVKYFSTDITNVDQIEAGVDSTVSWANETGATLGGVINCAGVGTAGKIIDAKGTPHPLDLWNFTLAVNLTGTFNLTRLALKHLINVKAEDGADGERGVIIMVSSAAAFEGQPGQTAYSATKGALRSMTLPLARDLSRYGVRVVTIAPGVFQSKMSDLLGRKARQSIEAALEYPRRFGRADEFAETVKWIIECAYVNGETVRLSGGVRLPAKM